MNIYLATGLRSLPDYTEFCTKLKEKGYQIVGSLTEAVCSVVTAGRVWRVQRGHTQIVYCSLKEQPALEEQGTLTCTFLWQALNYLNDVTPKEITSSYMFSGYSCARLKLHALLKGYQQIQEPRRGEKIGYLHVDASLTGRKDRRLYNLTCYCKNAVVPQALDLVCDKRQLFLQPQLVDYLPKTWYLEEFVFQAGLAPLIVKPAGVGAYKGVGISIVNSEEELLKAKNTIAANKQWQGIVSSYIDKPLLFYKGEEGYKFHLRVYMLVTSKNTYSVFSKAHIFTAAQPYLENDYSKTRTDSHGTSTEKDWEFSLDNTKSDFTEAMLQKQGLSGEVLSSLKTSVLEVCAAIWSVLQGKIETYAESDYGYEVIAPDILFDTNLKPWLLEVNRKVGLASSNVSTQEIYARWTDDFWTWVYEQGIAPGLV